MRTDDFSQQLREAFRIEASELIHSLLDKLVKLELANDAQSAEIIEQCFRDLHNLKGSAHAVEFTAAESLCHPMEDIISSLKAKVINPSATLIDLMIEGVNCIQRFCDADGAEIDQHTQEVLLQLQAIAQQSAGHSSSEAKEEGAAVAEMQVQSVTILSDFDTHAPSPSGTTSDAGRHETLRVSIDKLDTLMLQSEEMLSPKAMVRECHGKVTSIATKVNMYNKQWLTSAVELKECRKFFEKMRAASTSAKEQRLWKKMNDMLEVHGEFLESISGDMKQLLASTAECAHGTDNAVNSLLDVTKQLLMMPCSSLFAGFPVLVRQLGRQLDKEVEMSITGGDIELDKRILSTMKDPLIHILRNCIDHGLESPAERAAAGKPRRGTLRIDVKQLDAMVEIRVSDDGKGIDATRIRATALRQSIVSRQDLDNMPDDEILRLIFRSAFSTSQNVTEISGRGIGLAIVDEKVRLLGGKVHVQTVPEKGTTFIFTLPLTIATFRGVLVDVVGETFVVPTTGVERIVRVDKNDVRPVDGINTFVLEDTLVPIYPMEDALQMSRKDSVASNSKWLTVSVLGGGFGRVGFVVDDVLEEQEVLVKSLGPVFAGTPNVSGVTILGSGKVAPILNVSDLLSKTQASKARRSAGSSSENRRQPSARAEKAGARRVLVVDDSVTARMLLRNVLQSAGFDVKTANDGSDAFELLKGDSFDLVVTDIEMPRMNGFQLTEKIRADKGLKDVPVIIVTSMTSQADRAHGVSAGANAYFVKNDFDEGNLLDVVASLI